MNRQLRLMTMAVVAVMCKSTLSAATTGSAFLKIAPGAREQGMATAVTAVGGSLQSGYLNPAGIAGGSGYEFAVSHIELAQENKMENLTFGHNGLGGRFAYGVTYVHYGDLEGRDGNGALTGNFTAYDAALQITYARNFGHLAIGGALKGVRNKIENESGNGFGFDAGAIYRFERWRFGASIVNAGKSGKVGSMDENLPATVAVGGAVILKSLTVAADYKRNIPENRTVLAGGGELSLLNILAVRVGYSRDITNKDKEPAENMKGLSAGFGIVLALFKLDYAYTSQGEVGNNHRFTLTAKF